MQLEYVRPVSRSAPGPNLCSSWFEVRRLPFTLTLSFVTPWPLSPDARLDCGDDEKVVEVGKIVE